MTDTLDTSWDEIGRGLGMGWTGPVCRASPSVFYIAGRNCSQVCTPILHVKLQLLLLNWEITSLRERRPDS